MRHAVFDPSVRAALKQASRELDAARIARGDISPREMQRQNSISSLMKDAVILPQVRRRKPIEFRQDAVDAKK